MEFATTLLESFGQAVSVVLQSALAGGRPSEFLLGLIPMAIFLFVVIRRTV